LRPLSSVIRNLLATASFERGPYEAGKRNNALNASSLSILTSGWLGTPICGCARQGPFGTHWTRTSFDANVLTFTFVPTTNQVSFQYVFGSEEYNEWVLGQNLFND
jgi:hypothetical protein